MKKVDLFGFTTAQKLIALQEAYESFFNSLIANAEPKGEYKSSNTYSFGDLVSYNGGSYIYTSESDTTSIDPAHTDYWFQIASKGERGPQGIQGQVGPVGPQGSQGNQGIQGIPGTSIYTAETSFMDTSSSAYVIPKNIIFPQEPQIAYNDTIVFTVTGNTYIGRVTEIQEQGVRVSVKQSLRGNIPSLKILTVTINKNIGSSDLNQIKYIFSVPYVGSVSQTHIESSNNNVNRQFLESALNSSNGSVLMSGGYIIPAGSGSTYPIEWLEFNISGPHMIYYYDPETKQIKSAQTNLWYNSILSIDVVDSNKIVIPPELNS